MNRAANAVALIEILDEKFGSQDRQFWEERFSNTDLIWAPANDYAEVAADPQMMANNYIVEVDHPTHGQVKMVGSPVRLSKTPGQITRPAPEYGQHTEEILLELGYSWDDISRMNEEEVV